MIDETGNEISVGRSEYDSPEIDNIVHVRSSQETGSIKDVVISDANEYELIGDVKQ